MARFQNKQGITRITFQARTHNFCPIGQAHYTNTVKVEMVPGDIIPDYDEVQADMKALDGETLIIEDAVAKVFDNLNQYGPKELTVSSRAEGNGHFPVIVEKTL
jgi:hypothetical protein